MEQTNSPFKFNRAVDTEHNSFRFAIVAIYAVFTIIIYLILDAIMPEANLNIIAGIIALVIAAVLTQQVERTLKARWPSGRVLAVNQADKIQILQNDTVQHEVNGQQQVNVLLWRFTVSRRARVPKGWHMIACALEQDETYVPVYTLISPDAFDALKAEQHFTVLISPKEQAKQQGGDLRLAGEQRRLHLAESNRWNSGAEVSNDDFIAYIRYLQGQYPQWMQPIL